MCVFACVCGEGVGIVEVSAGAGLCGCMWGGVNCLF